MRKNLEVDVPKGAHTEVQRKQGLKKSIFTRTRIAVLSLILVLSLSVTGTLAYLQWSANQTPNRSGIGQVDIRIGERASIDATAVKYNEDGTYDAGQTSKVVAIYAGESQGQLEESVSVSLVPEVEAKNVKDTDNKTVSDAFLAFNENWSDVKTDSTTNCDYIDTSIVKVYLAQGWSDNWLRNSDGTFTYKQTIKKGEKTTDLVTGVVLTDGVNSTDYSSVRLSVIARSVQSTSTGS